MTDKNKNLEYRCLWKVIDEDKRTLFNEKCRPCDGYNFDCKQYIPKNIKSTYSLEKEIKDDKAYINQLKREITIDKLLIKYTKYHGKGVYNKLTKYHQKRR